MAEQSCSRCGYTQENDSSRFRRTMLLVEMAQPDQGRVWVCDFCHAPKERILEVIRPRRV